LFEIQAAHSSNLTERHAIAPVPRQTAYAVFGQPSVQPNHEALASSANGEMEMAHLRNTSMDRSAASPSVALAHSFLRLAELPNSALDRLSRYEAALWRQVVQILVALDALDSRKPQERGGLFRMVSRQRASVLASPDYRSQKR
jgi:hypothetical protein